MALSRERELLLGRLRQRRTREREGLFLVEGVRSAEEALSARAAMRFAVVSPRLSRLEGGAALRGRLAQAGMDIVEVGDGELTALADTEAPQGILLVCVKPKPPSQEFEPGNLLVLDGVQDPGNAGTLVRAAAAFGVAGVVALDGTVDPYNPKAVRAAAGALFRIPIRCAAWEEIECALRDRGPLLMADMGGVDVGSARPDTGWALVIGREGAGPRPAVRGAATGTVAIPMPGGGGSLNAGVAGAILLYVLTRESGRV